MHVVIPYVIAALLFGLGVYGVLRRRNAILVLMAVELMLNAVNLIFVAADSTMIHPTLVGVPSESWSHAAPEPRAGSIFALFVIVLAAAEVGIGLAIILQFYRLRKAIAIDDIPLHEADEQDYEDQEQVTT